MTLSINKKELLKEFVDYNCESCGKIYKSEELEIHRLKRCGSYTLNNIKVICERCHKDFHANEWGWIKSK